VVDDGTARRRFGGGEAARQGGGGGLTGRGGGSGLAGRRRRLWFQRWRWRRRLTGREGEGGNIDLCQLGRMKGLRPKLNRSLLQFINRFEI
jgi:hypothetical protein